MGWGGRLLEADGLLTLSAFKMDAYSRWALIRGWALIRINTVTRLALFSGSFAKWLLSLQQKQLPPPLLNEKKASRSEELMFPLRELVLIDYARDFRHISWTKQYPGAAFGSVMSFLQRSCSSICGCRSSRQAGIVWSQTDLPCRTPPVLLVGTIAFQM